MLSAVNISTSTISNLIIISQLNHFTFVSALLLPVLRLNLTLPFRLQGLGTGGWLDPTRQDFPVIYNQLTKASRVSSARQRKSAQLISQLAPYLYYTIFYWLIQLLFCPSSITCVNSMDASYIPIAEARGFTTHWIKTPYHGFFYIHGMVFSFFYILFISALYFVSYKFYT